MTTPAPVKQADMVRALRAAKKLGAARVTIGKDGSIIFDMEADRLLKAQPGVIEEAGPLIKIRERPTKKLVF